MYVDRGKGVGRSERENQLGKSVKSNGKGYSIRMLCELFSNFSVSLKFFQNRKLKTWSWVLFVLFFQLKCSLGGLYFLPVFSLSVSKSQSPIGRTISSLLFLISVALPCYKDHEFPFYFRY